MLASTVDTLVEFIKKSIASGLEVYAFQLLRSPFSRIDNDTVADDEAGTNVLSRRKLSRWPVPLPDGVF